MKSPLPTLVLALLAASCGQKPDPKPVAPAPQKGVFVDDIDRTADPCTDFYQYANGKWRADHPIPASQSRWSRRWESGELAKERLKGILDDVSARTDWPARSVEQLIGDFYGACMDEDRVNQLGIAPLRPLLDQIAAIKDRAGVQRMIQHFHQIELPVPFQIYGGSDLHTPTDVIAFIAANGLGLPDRDYYFKPEERFVAARARYLEHIAKMFALAGRTDGDARAKVVFEMEKRLAAATLDNVARRDPSATDHKMTVAELGKLVPSFDWAAYFTAMNVPPSPLNVDQPAFMTAIEHELSKTPVDAWRSYLEWQLLANAAPSLSQDFVDQDFAFNRKFLAGIDEPKPRWKRCAEATDLWLGEALGQKYVEKYFPPEAKARVLAMVNNMLAAMKDTIDGLTWMSAATKQRALEKLATFDPKIGYPDKWKDYSSIAVSRDALWDSTVAARRWYIADNLGTIGKPLDRGRWGMTPPTSDAYYNPSLNEMVFPAGILQEPGFRLDAADPINYGSIGVVIGHEISHGFDDQGAKFDAQGRLENWWTASDLTEFEKRGQCVVDQFEAYFVEPGLHQNGKLVLGESIGDLGGVTLAYRGLQKAMKDNPAPTLDGFTPDQQFFIAWGQWRGDAVRPEFARLMVQGDPHPIAKYRIIGPLSNVPAFAETFSCKPDAPMVRANRCQVW
jgi:putative endopeptidase